MAESSGAGHSPLAQFEIKPLYKLELGGYDDFIHQFRAIYDVSVFVDYTFCFSAQRSGRPCPGDGRK